MKIIEDKDIEDTLSKSGEIIFRKVLEKMKNIKSQAYEPKCVVLSEGYLRMLDIHLREINYCYCIPEQDKVLHGVEKISKLETILGLKIVTTQLPDILEVY